MLIADDHEDTGAIMALLVHDEFRCDTQAVVNGRLAVGAASLRRLTVCLLDIDMPVMGGVEAAGLIRLTHPGSPRVLIIAITGGSGRRARESGHFDAVLSKPSDLAELFGLIRQG